MRSVQSSSAPDEILASRRQPIMFSSDDNRSLHIIMRYRTKKKKFQEWGTSQKFGRGKFFW